MFETKDTLAVTMEPYMDLKSATQNNKLFFKKRCRSRSFEELPDLLNEEVPDSPVKAQEDLYGYGSEGQRFEFKPSNYSIVSKYLEIEKLFEDTLSPTVVTLTKSPFNNKVNNMLNITYNCINAYYWCLYLIG